MTIISTSNHCKENKLPGEETFRKKKEIGGGCWIREEERTGGFTGGSSLSLQLAEISTSNILGASPKRPCCPRMRGTFLSAQSHYFLERLNSLLPSSSSPSGYSGNSYLPPIMRLLPFSMSLFWGSTVEDLASISIIIKNSFWGHHHPFLSSPSLFPMGPK